MVERSGSWCVSSQNNPVAPWGYTDALPGEATVVPDFMIPYVFALQRDVISILGCVGGHMSPEMRLMYGI